MTTSRIRIAAATAIAGTLVGTGSLAALAAGTGTVSPPPRIAFVARSDNPADALSVGPTAGQLGAPVFVTAPTSLVPSTQAGLVAYAPELVIIAGGFAAIDANVEAAIETALGLPDDKVVRAAGEDRFQTAVAISDLLAAHNPAFLPVEATATDSDLLDGLDSAAFLMADQKADIIEEAQSDTMWALLNPTNNPTFGFTRQSGHFSDGVHVGVGDYTVQVDRDISDCSYQATLGNNTIGDANAMFVTVNTNQFDDQQLVIRTYDETGAAEDVLNAYGIHLLVTC